MPTYHCQAARKDIRALFDVLHAEGVLQTEVYDDWLDAMFRACGHCENQPRRCRGWTVSISPNAPLQFADADHQHRVVRVELTAEISFVRSAPAKDADWQSAPVASLTMALLLFGDDASPIERHHVDLANQGQPGPLWHLQAGGNPPGHSKFASSWLKIPRWPTVPADLVLWCEMVVMNFFPVTWQALRENGQWAHVVQRAEDLLLTRYSGELTAYLARASGGSRDGTWLERLCDADWRAG